MPLRSALTSVVALCLMSPTALAAEVVVQNDSTAGGVPSTVANFFIPGESTASWLSASCAGDIVALQVYWASQFGGAPTQIEQALTLFSAGSFPTPGAPLAAIPGPTLSDGSMNEFRTLDPPTNAVPLQIPVSSGQAFVVALQFQNQSSGNAFAPSVTTDQDGCQAGANSVDVLPGGWSDACALGVTGDWVIRAVIDCAAPVAVPALGGPGGAVFVAVLLLAAFGVGGRIAARAAA